MYDAAQRARKNAAVREQLAAVKIERGCADCGYREHSAALDFDHVRGEKQFNIGNGVCRRPQVLWAEVDKCDVVCANCHRIRTLKRKQPGGK